MKQLVPQLHGDKRKLIVLICLLLASGFLAVSLFNYHVSKGTLREALVTRELPLTSDNIYSEIQKDLIRPIFISSMMGTDTFLRDWVLQGEQETSRITRYLREVRERYGAFTSFFVSERTRFYYHPDRVLKQVSEKEPRDAWYYRVRNMTDPYEINVDPDMANHDAMTIFINYRVQDYEGRFIGAAGVGLTVDAVKKLIESYRLRYQRQIYFVDRQGRIVLHSPRSPIGADDIRRVEGLGAIADEILRAGSGSFQYRGGGEQHLLNVRYIPELKWYLFVEKVEETGLAELRRTLLLNLGVCLVVTLIMLLLVNITVNYYQRRLEEMATTDALTGLANRQSFELLSRQVLADAERYARSFAVLIADIDHFKEINDTRGHLAGDQVLREVAGLLRSRLRGSDIICRWGGEEFLVVLANSGADEARPVADQLREAVRAHFRGTTPPGAITISVGIAAHQPGESLDRLLGRADDALYKAKNAGRDRVCVAADRSGE